VTTTVDLAAAVIVAYNRHDLAAYERLHAPDARIEFAGAPGDIGLGEWLTILARLFAVLPDLTIRPMTVVTDDATAVIEMRQIGTNTGVLALDDGARMLLGTDLAQIPPTGRTVDTPGVVVFTVGDGVVTGERHHWPPHWVFEQLGLVTVSAVPTGAVPTLAVIRS